jgi:hypothetical protein
VVSGKGLDAGGPRVIVFLLILHGLVGVALLGAITHQTISVLRPAGQRGQSFPAKYAGVTARTFCNAVMLIFAANVVLGGSIYPTYRLDVRIPLEEMRLGWALGLFEMKEHFGGIGLASLPIYSYYWKADSDSGQFGRIAITCTLAFIVWFDFLVGHILNNIRGF